MESWLQCHRRYNNTLVIKTIQRVERKDGTNRREVEKWKAEKQKNNLASKPCCGPRAQSPRSYLLTGSPGAAMLGEHSTTPHLSLEQPAQTTSAPPADPIRSIRWYGPSGARGFTKVSLCNMDYYCYHHSHFIAEKLRREVRVPVCWLLRLCSCFTACLCQS